MKSFTHKDIKIWIDPETTPGGFDTRGLCKMFGTRKVIRVSETYASELEKLALRSSNCTDKTRRKLARRIVDRAIADRCQKC
jgi:hypothetical protein